jgi:molecular chaperone DnaK (HSP70)
MIVVLSPDSLASNNVMDEVSYALEGGKLVVPILFRSGPIPFRLRRVHHIDFTSAYDVAFPQLLRALNIKRSAVSDHHAFQETATQDSKASKASVELPTSPDGHGGKVLPFAIGIETLGGVFTKLIPEQTLLPLRHAEIFSTASDNQSSVEVNVMIGVRPLAKDNLTIGKFHLVGIPPAPRGMPQIEVLFEIDTEGIVNVSAKDLDTGRQQKITISSKPSKKDIERILRESQLHLMDDARRIEEIEARNRLDGLTYQMEKTVNQNREKVEPAVALEVAAAIADAKAAMIEGGVDRLNDSFTRLQTSSHKLAAAIHQQHPVRNEDKKGVSEILEDLFGKDPFGGKGAKR